MGNVRYKVSSESEEGMRVKVNNGRGHEIIIDEPEQLGGTDQGMNPVEVTLASLAGCFSITASLLAKKMKVSIDNLKVEAAGEIDEKAMSSKEVDSGFKEVDIVIKIKSQSSKDKIEELFQNIELFCPVSDSLKRSISIKSDYELNS